MGASHSEMVASAPAGAGPLLTTHGLREVPTYSPSARSYPEPVKGLFYSAGGPA